MATPFSRDLFCGARNLNQLWESDQKSNLATISSRDDYNIMHTLFLSDRLCMSAPHSGSLSPRSALYARPSNYQHSNTLIYFSHPSLFVSPAPAMNCDNFWTIPSNELASPCPAAQAWAI